MNDDARHVGLDYHSHLKRNRPNVSIPEGVEGMIKAFLEN